MKTKHFSGIKYHIQLHQSDFYLEIIRFNGSVQLFIENKNKRNRSAENSGYLN